MKKGVVLAASIILFGTSFPVILTSSMGKHPSYHRKHKSQLSNTAANMASRKVRKERPIWSSSSSPVVQHHNSLWSPELAFLHREVHNWKDGGHCHCQPETKEFLEVRIEKNGSLISRCANFFSQPAYANSRRLWKDRRKDGISAGNLLL